MFFCYHLMKTGKKRLINVRLSKSNGERTNIKKDKSKRTGADSRSGGVLNSNSSSGFSPSAGNHCRHKDVHERGSQVDGIPIPTPILITTKSLGEKVFHILLGTGSVFSVLRLCSFTKSLGENVFHILLGTGSVFSVLRLCSVHQHRWQLPAQTG